MRIFSHSYRMTKLRNGVSLRLHNGHEFISAYRGKNIFGAQPEKKLIICSIKFSTP